MVECHSTLWSVALALSIFVLVCAVNAVNINDPLVVLVPLVAATDLQNTRIWTSLNLLLAVSAAIHKNFFPIALITSF